LEALTRRTGKTVNIVRIWISFHTEGQFVIVVQVSRPAQPGLEACTAHGAHNGR